MSNFSDPSSEALAIAGGAVASALLDLLVERKFISANEARVVCERAQDRIKAAIGMRGDLASAPIEEMVRSLPQK
jgi:hypothetical protein